MLLKLQQLKWHPEALSSAAGVMGSSSDSDLSGIFFPGKRRPKKVGFLMLMVHCGSQSGLS